MRFGAFLLFLVLVHSLAHSVVAQAPGTEAVAPRASRAPAEFDSLSLKLGRAAMWRSVALDGWGQAYNKDWLKAAVFSGAEISILLSAVSQHNEWRRARDRTHELPDGTSEDIWDYYQEREAFYLRDRNKLLWWWLWLKIAAVLDAYVSGSMSNFDADWRGEPAFSRDESATPLPGASLAPIIHENGAPGMQLRLPLK